MLPDRAAELTRQRPARARVVAGVVLLLGAAVAGCGDDGPGRDEQGALVEAGPVSVHHLAVGDCFDDPADLSPDEPGEAIEVDARPCDEPHDNQVFAVVEVPDADGYPGADEVQDEGRARCAAELTGFVGEDPPERVEVVAYLFPTPASWEDGDREVLCALYHASEPKLTGSLAAAGRDG